MTDDTTADPTLETATVDTGPDAGGTDEVSDDELQRRVVFSLLQPAIRLAKRYRVPLKEFTQWLQIAYFQELRSSGLTLREAGELMDVGMRKASELSRSMKENFFKPERDHELPRRIEFMLWAEPLSRARIHQLMRAEEPALLDEAIERLVAEGRIQWVDGKHEVLEVTGTQARLVKPTWMSQVDGINQYGRNLASATHERVFEDSDRALLRTLSFRIAPSDVDALQALYEDDIFARLEQLEHRAQGRSDALTMTLSICWSEGSDAPSTAQEEGSS